MINFKSLPEPQKIQYRKISEHLFGYTNVYTEHEEPLYFDENYKMVDVSEKIIFSVNHLN